MDILSQHKARADFYHLTAIISIQGYLAHEKLSPPQDHHRALGMVLLKGPRGGGALMSEVQGYLGHTEQGC